MRTPVAIAIELSFPLSFYHETLYIDVFRNAESEFRIYNATARLIKLFLVLSVDSGDVAILGIDLWQRNEKGTEPDIPRDDVTSMCYITNSFLVPIWCHSPSS